MAPKSMADLKQKEREARRRLILESARELFAEKDFRSVTVREIAKKAGTSVGTIYNYYANLTELFLDVFLTHAEEITVLLDAEAKDRPLSLERICMFYIQYLNENMTFYQMMGHFMLGGELSAEGTQRLNTIMKILMDRIVSVINPIGIYRNPRLIAHTLFAALNGIMISYARYPGRNPDEIRKHTLRLASVVSAVFEQKSI